MTRNLKPAPLALTPALVAKLTGDRPAHGKGIARIAIEGVLVAPDAVRPAIGVFVEPVWCAQCDRKVDAATAARCASQFCKAKAGNA